MMTKVEKYMAQHHMLAPGDTVAAGISGGADSVCLLFVLWELAQKMQLNLLVVHVNHGIRQEAAADGAYVKQLCIQLGLPFFLIETDVHKLADEQGISEEEAGRNIRYESFIQILKQQAPKAWAEGKAKIAVAHNSNDRAETMLFHLCRGTGLDGLCAIRPVRGQIIRPLLCVERKEIEKFLSERKISYCTDSTNEEDTYTRNKIRHHVLPYMESEVCSKAVCHMNRTADFMEQNADYIRQETQKAVDRCVTMEGNRCWESKISINVPAFQKEHPFIRQQIILFCMEKMTAVRKDITSVHVAQIMSLFEKEGSKQIHLPYRLTAQKEYDKVYLYKNDKSKQGTDILCESQGQEDNPVYEVEIPSAIWIDGLGTLEFEVTDYEKCQDIPQNQYTKWLDYDKIKKSLMLRTRRTGDYLTINENLAKKSLKDYMIQEKIPKARRGHIWVLADGSHILWVIGYRISQNYKVSKNTKRVLKIQLRGGQ